MIQAADEERSTQSRRELVRRELWCVLAVTVLVMVAALFLPVHLGQAPVASHGPEKVQAPWVFAGLQEMLRYLPAWAAGVALPLLGLLTLFLMPWLAGRLPRIIWLPIFLALIVAGTGLTVLGLSH